MMQKLGFAGMKGLDHLRSLGGSLAGSVKNPPVSILRASSDSVSLGSFANLKLTAEKLVKEQASVKTDLELANAKLKKSMEQIHLLEVKLQEAVNENAKLQVKQTEDSKLWKGLDSKLLSTKTLCDQLTETLQHLAAHVRSAEEDKIFFEGKISDNSKAFDDLKSHLNGLSAKLEYGETLINSGKHEILELRQEKQELEERLRLQCESADGSIKQRDAVIGQLNSTLEEYKVQLHMLNSQLQEAQHELLLKEDICKSMKTTQESLENEKNTLQCSNEDFAQKIELSHQEITKLETMVHVLATTLTELDEQSRSISRQILELFSLSETCYGLVQQEKDLGRKFAQHKFNQLDRQLSLTESEKVAFKLENEELKNKIMELQKAQEIAMVQHADECHVAEDKIRILESEAETLISKKSDLEKLASELEEKVKHLSEVSSLTENQMEVLKQKVAKLESENQDLHGKVHSMKQERAQETEAFQNEITRHEQHADSVIQASLAASESKLAEASKQYDSMLEGKQLELSKHLKELSQRNDQAINDIRRKYEMEKVEIAKAEKEKADNLVKDMEKRCDEKLSENKQEAHQYVMRIKEEHATLISRIQQDHDQKESTLKEHQKEELQRVHLQAENELRERISSLRKEHEIQMKSQKLQYEDEYRKLQEELELQKSKEEKQRALLQLQWRVMDENQQDDQEVNSKKEYSVSSIKMRDLHGRKEHQHASTRSESGRKDVNLSGLMRTPMVKLMKKVEKGNLGSAVSIPKHSKGYKKLI
ncbi:hypothetical protein J5N97_016992 [Dioscorea zingiberensis]|uniref:Synaptonemal complex protein 2 n=1 Tax=Dioscorea zingiberensis TaxID=325984 RepID=A0A9D5CMB5_9LILI|nr:hypothetical protein J5N97_016992 [Dioscorea zingiberensis]